MGPDTQPYPIWIYTCKVVPVAKSDSMEGNGGSGVKAPQFRNVGVQLHTSVSLSGRANGSGADLLGCWWAPKSVLAPQ
jgi:hypothetical protein